MLQNVWRLGVSRFDAHTDLKLSICYGTVYSRNKTIFEYKFCSRKMFTFSYIEHGHNFFYARKRSKWNPALSFNSFFEWVQLDHYLIFTRLQFDHYFFSTQVQFDHLGRNSNIIICKGDVEEKPSSRQYTTNVTSDTTSAMCRYINFLIRCSFALFYPLSVGMSILWLFFNNYNTYRQQV
jgi:hypothetical protein